MGMVKGHGAWGHESFRRTLGCIIKRDSEVSPRKIFEKAICDLMHFGNVRVIIILSHLTFMSETFYMFKIFCGPNCSWLWLYSHHSQ